MRLSLFIITLCGIQLGQGSPNVRSEVSNIDLAFFCQGSPRKDGPVTCAFFPDELKQEVDKKWSNIDGIVTFKLSKVEFILPSRKTDTGDAQINGANMISSIGIKTYRVLVPIGGPLTVNLIFGCSIGSLCGEIQRTVLMQENIGIHEEL